MRGGVPALRRPAASAAHGRASVRGTPRGLRMRGACAATPPRLHLTRVYAHNGIPSRGPSARWGGCRCGSLERPARCGSVVCPRFALRSVALSLLGRRAVVGTRAGTTGNAWRRHWRGMWRHLEGIRAGHTTSSRRTPKRRPEPQHGTPFHPVNVLRVVPGHEKWHEPECQANVCSAFAPPSLVDTSSTVLYQYFS